MGLYTNKHHWGGLTLCVCALRHANFMFLQGSGRHLNLLPAHQSINQLEVADFPGTIDETKTINQSEITTGWTWCFKYLQILSHLGMVLETHMITCGVKKPQKQRHFFGFRAANFCQELTGSASIIHSSQKYGGFLSHGESPIAGLLRVEHPKTGGFRGTHGYHPILFVYFRQDPGSGMGP